MYRYIFKHKRKMVITVHKFNYITTTNRTQLCKKRKQSFLREKKCTKLFTTFLLKYSSTISFLTPSATNLDFWDLSHATAITGIWSCKDKRCNAVFKSKFLSYPDYSYVGYNIESV